MTYTTNFMTFSTTDSIASSRPTRWLCAVMVALQVWLLTPSAWAECPGDCYTDEEANECRVCLLEQEALRRTTKDKEQERNEAIAALNLYKGRLAECRTISKARALELDDTRARLQEAQDRPTWWVVIGVGLGALVVGGGVGLVVGLD